MKRSNLCVTQPVETEDIKLSNIKTIAAGVPAITSSVNHMIKELNPKICASTLFSVNQVDGFDCPGCAWPDPDDAEDRSSLGEYCENGVKAIAEEATTERIENSFFEKYSVQELSQWSDYKLGKSGRLTHPMYLPKGKNHYEPVSWEKAFDLIAEELHGLDHPNEAIFYTSGKTTNEAAFVYQLFVRQFGTNNMPDCSNMCHETSGVALSETLGIGKGSVRLEDFYITDLIMIVGQNPGTNHPRMMTALQKAKRAGAKIISVNPLPETGLMRFKHPQSPTDILSSGTQLTDLFLQVKINEDLALFKAILKLLLEKERANPNTIFDHEFIQNKTDGYDELVASLEDVNVAELAQQAGLTLEQVEEAAELIANAKKMIICWAMGITQHKNGVANIQELVNLLLLKGSIGKPGAGTCPVRGHSNVQGDRTMGVWEKLKPELAKNLEKNFDFVPPKEEGYNTVNSIKAMHEGKAKFFFGMGGNFMSATPDTAYTAEALQNCSMTVQVSTKLNRGHLVTGDAALILPCLGRTERDIQASGKQFVSVENSMGVVHQSNGSLEPASNMLMSEVGIVCCLAKAVLENSKTDWLGFMEDYDRIRCAVEKTIPGFKNYNQRVREPGGFYLPNGAREGNFDTNNNKAHLTVNQVPNHQLEAHQYRMMTIRSHDQFNTTIYGLNDRYRGIENGRRVIMMHPDDIKKSGFQKGDYVDLIGYHEGKKRVAPHFMIVEYDIPQQCVATYFPETNILVPIDSYASECKTPASKLVIIELESSNYR